MILHFGEYTVAILPRIEMDMVLLDDRGDYQLNVHQGQVLANAARFALFMDSVGHLDLDGSAYADLPTLKGT